VAPAPRRDLYDQSGGPLDHQRRSVPAGDEVAMKHPLQHLPPMSNGEFPERPSPLRLADSDPDVVDQDVEPTRFGTYSREELVHF